MLGRPFGAPNQPEFQRSVLRALLALFERRWGPVLDDFPEDAPVSDAEEPAGAAAPSLSRAAPDAVSAEVLQREIAELARWYEVARQRRGRTTVGICGMRIEDAASFVASYLSSAPTPPGLDGVSAGVALKRACDDLKAYYCEAVAAQPGALTAQAIDRWFWQDTVVARVFLALRHVCLGSADASLRALGETALVPRAILHTPVAPARTPPRP